MKERGRRRSFLSNHTTATPDDGPLLECDMVQKSIDGKSRGLKGAGMPWQWCHV